MKLSIQIILLFLLFGYNMNAQIGRGKITAAEYFFDADPGLGLGTALTLQGGVNEALRTAIQTANITLPAGLHKLSVRMKDSLNNWGPTFKTVFNVENAITSGRAVQVSLARFYWDANVAGATNLIILNGNITDPINTFINSAPLSTFSTSGLHKINIQMLDGASQYGPVFATAINIESPNSFSRIISAALGRVWWDNNFGTLVGLIILNGNASNSINEFITASPISTFSSPGLHKLNVQLIDPNGSGNYSPTFSTSIKFDQAIDTVRAIRVDAARVWFDNAIPSSPNMIAFDGNFNQSIEEAIQSLPAPTQGLHTLSVQMRDSTPSHWGPIFKTTLIVETPLSYRNINIATGQLYWDNDTNNNPQTLIAFDGAFDNAIEEAFKNNVTVPTLGMHTICARFKDVANNWSNPFRLSIIVEDSLFARNIKVVQGEVRVDNTPPLTIVALNGSFNNALQEAQATILTSGISTGLHRLLVRMKGLDGAWGPYFISSILVSPCATSPMPTITNSLPLSFCYPDSTVLTAPSGFNSYQWIYNNTVVGTNQSFVARDSGAYIVIVTDGTNCPGASQPKLVNSHHPIVNITTGPVYCQGSIDTLYATPGFTSYSWSGGGTSNKKVITTGGTYTVTVTDAFGCTSSATKTITQLPQPPIPIITANGPTALCPGTNVVLTSSATSNILWSNGSSSPSITVDTTGSFSVTVTGTNGCKSTSAITNTIKYATTATTVSANGPLTFCDGNSVTLTINPGGLSYTWYKSGVPTGATSRSTVITSAGTYSVTMIDSNSCPTTSTSSTITVNPNPAIPTVTANGPLSFCNGGTVVLTSSSATNNTWSNGVTAQSQTIYNSGTYVDTVTNGFGCKSWSLPKIVDVHPTASISASGPTTFCNGLTVSLTASPLTGVNYLWSNGSTAQTVNISSTQNLSVIVTETATGCKDTAFQNVIVHPLPTGNITASGATTVCNGFTIPLNATGSANTKFQWYVNGNPIYYLSYNIYCNCLVPVYIFGNTYTVTSSGIYTAKIIDTLTGCESFTNPINANVILPPVPTITANGGTTLCIGANTVLSASSASSYLWNTGATTQTIIASTQGNYSVIITDANGCTRASNPTPVTFFPVASISSSGPTTFCAGGNISLTANPIGTYLWTNGSTNSTIANITSTGTYGVTVTDANGCTSTATPVNVIVNPLPTGSLSAAGPTTVCQNNAVSLNAVGSANTKFRWFKDGSAIFYLSYNIFCNCYVPIYTYGSSYGATTTGNYSVEITDTLTGCISMSNHIPVTILPLPIPTISQTAPIPCFGGNNAALFANATGTLAPYTYLWNTGASSQSISNLVANTYTVQATDFYGCTSITSFTVTQPSLVSAFASTPTNTRGYNVSCFGSTDGSATVFASGGTSPYTYLWSNGSTSSSITGIGAGTYTVTVKDANNCLTYSTTVTLMQPQAISVTASPSVFYGGKNISCFGGSNGSVTAIPSGGTANFTYLWSNGQTTNAISGLPIGTYSVIATDSVGCTGTATATLLQPSAISSALTPSVYNGYNVSCNGSSDGTISLVNSGGTPPYHYSWSDTNTSQNRTSLLAGTYHVNIIDTLGCVKHDSIVLSQPTPIVNTTSGSLLNCYGDSNGVATALVSGGNGPYTYAWSNGATSSTVSNLKADFYLVTVTDARGCTKVDQVQVTQPTQVTGYAFGTYIGCGSQIGLLSVSGTGGTSPYTFMWSNGATTSFQTNQPLGTYTVSVTDSHGCWDTAQAIILSPPTLSATSSADYHASCDSITTVPAGTVSVTASGGVTPYLYLWNNGATTPSINQLGTGTYTCIITDANGCTVAPTASVYNNDPAVILGNPIICNGAVSTTLSTILSNSYTWSNASGVVGTSQNVNVGIGTYTLTATNLNGCINSDSITVVNGQCPTILNLKLFIQGYYSGFETMTPVLLNQGVSFNSTITDTITVQLRSAQPPYGIISSNKTILHTDGTATATFPAFSGNCYIAVLHRNALQTWSADSIAVGPIPTTYDFTTSSSQAYGNNMVELELGVWGFYSGDVNYDENLDLLDIAEIDVDISNFAFGYKETDLNGDGNVDLLDPTSMAENVNNFIFSSHP